MTIQTIIQTVEADGAKALAEVKAGLTYIDDEAKGVIAWVEKEVPGSAGAIAVFLQGADTEAANLAKAAANGLSTQIAAGGADVETFLMNFINASGFSANAQSGLKALDASAVAFLEGIGKSLITTGLASILAKLAPAIAAAV